MQQQQEFNQLLRTLMESVEKFQSGESGEGNYLVAMNCLRSLHGFGGRIGDDAGRLRSLVDDLEIGLQNARDDLLHSENELEKLRDWRACMCTFSDDPDWCKRCGSWDSDEGIKETEEYGYLCLSCRDDLDCLFDDEIEEAKKEAERRRKIVEGEEEEDRF